MSSGRRRQMKMVLFAQGVGVAQSVWRSPRTEPERLHTLGYWADLAQLAEAGRFDAFFLADTLNLSPSITADAITRPDPVAVLSALSAVTSRIGLVGTSSTTYNDPFTVARQFATLDHLSEGRAGWNVVTTAIAAAAANHGAADLPDHGDRYARAEEFVDVVTALWQAWDADAIVADRASGVYAEADRIRAIDHLGSHFQVRGPLNVPRSPQGRLPLAQAGSSGPGMDLGARVGNLLFTTQLDLGQSQAFVADVKRRAEAFGRSPDDVKVLPGLTPVLGRTEAEARELAEELGSHVSEQATLQFLQQSFGGIDLSGYDLDAPFPDVRSQLPAHSSVSRPELFIRTALAEGLTLRQMVQRIGLSIGHRLFVGTPDSLVDEMERWFVSAGADGFVILPADLPTGFRDFVEEVVPRLQDRGLLRTEYRGRTLWEHLDD